MLYVLMSSMMLGDVQCIYKARNTQTVVKSVLHDFEQKELTWIHVSYKRRDNLLFNKKRWTLIGFEH